MHEKLTKYFIGISISEYDYDRVYRMLPTPSIESYQYSDGGSSRKKVLIYIVDNYIISAKQFRWIASIKHAMLERIRCDIIWFDEYFVTEKCTINGLSYDLKYLSNILNAERLIYPTPLFPSENQSIYRNLCMIATKLYKKDIFYKELLMAIAIDFNNKFSSTQRYSQRKLYAKVMHCMEFIVKQNPTSLKGNDLKLAHRKGGAIRATQVKKEKKENREMLNVLLNNKKYIKKNGKFNITLIAEEMGMTRQTISNYLKDFN